MSHVCVCYDGADIKSVSHCVCVLSASDEAEDLRRRLADVHSTLDSRSLVAFLVRHCSFSSTVYITQCLKKTSKVYL